MVLRLSLSSIINALSASVIYHSGTIPDARFPSTLPAISGANLTGIAATENIRTNTNATFLQNVNVSGTTTATTFIGDLTGDVTGDVTGTASKRHTGSQRSRFNRFSKCYSHKCKCC